MTHATNGAPIAAPAWQPRTADCYWREAQRTAFLAREALNREGVMNACRFLFAGVALAPFLLALFILATASDRAYHSLAEPIRIALFFAPTALLIGVAAACHFAMHRAHDAYVVLTALLEERLAVMETTREMVASIEVEMASAAASSDASHRVDLRLPRSAVPRVFHASATLVDRADAGNLGWHARRQVALAKAKGANIAS